MNKDLFWQHLETEHRRAEAFCRRLAGNRDDGEDLYHDSLVQAIGKFDTLRERGSFKPWLYRIIVNLYKSRLRNRRWKIVSPDPDIDGKVPIADPSNRIFARIWLDRAFRAISSEDRAMVTLFEIEGWSVAELAEMFGKPEGSIKSRLWRSRRKMREELARYFPMNVLKTNRMEAEYALPRGETSPE